VIEVLLGIALFTGVILSLVGLVLLARARLLPQGEVVVTVNGERPIAGRRGEKLVAALHAAGIRVPAGCGGKGVCGQCRVTLTRGGGPPLPTESARLTRAERAAGVRLACQVTLRENLDVTVPEEVFGVKEWTCRVRSSRCVATLIKEIVLELPDGETIGPPTGRYVQVTAPAYRLAYRDLPIDERVRDEWDRLDLWRLEASCDEPATRAYSMANHPGETGIITLLVRLATPPPSAPDAPPGVVSSWLFGLGAGDPVSVSGPYGHFTVEDGDSELIFVGGGAGMAPMRAHIFDLLLRRRTRRRISFWYGARHRREIFYAEDFDRLQAAHPNFSWTLALSEPRAEDAWQGATGFIHQVLYDRYLASHPAPETCDYYLCGPPLMTQAVRGLLDQLGVDPNRVRADDFGS
jgi:Na+-transporting NADH:ubiquinone oxidoreductase subunit F